MSNRSPHSSNGDPRRNVTGTSRHYGPFVLRNPRCQFVLDFLRRTRQRSPVHVTDLIDEYLTAEVGPISSDELPAVRSDLYQLFSRHCLVQMEEGGLVTYDRYHDTVKLR
ncbi:hypothetical protein HUG10_16280 [Halorarum halophilum]|uniref:DUF7344 domain-containing protein n=1 Tax=Halorarum halophilum TaxID=2743090 RepID=A0A7D5KXY7_9EURY|nr:hypothetical protein [Halobaculum halophilum]QLG28998.1 hypothetical protein HUG10_16280 [Halobaculum halophilum]